MLYGMKMFSRVFVLGGIAAAYMPTRQAKPEVDPCISAFEALLAAMGMRLYISNLVQMVTLFHVFQFADLLNGIRSARQVSPECDLALTLRDPGPFSPGTGHLSAEIVIQMLLHAPKRVIIPSQPADHQCSL
jgi:hypothetical protein